MAWQVEISSSRALETGSAVSDDSGHLKADGINDLIPKIDEYFHYVNLFSTRTVPYWKC